MLCCWNKHVRQGRIQKRCRAFTNIHHFLICVSFIGSGRIGSLEQFRPNPGLSCEHNGTLYRVDCFSINPSNEKRREWCHRQRSISLTGRDLYDRCSRGFFLHAKHDSSLPLPLSIFPLVAKEVCGNLSRNYDDFSCPQHTPP